MGIQLILVAAFFVATSNLCMRRSIDGGGTSKAFLTIQLFLVFLVAVLLNPVRTGDYTWSHSMAAFGLSGGIILALMMACLGKALESGPPALTFAVLNSSTVMPMILMVALFGSAFGYNYTLWHGVGSILVLVGLFWAARGALASLKVLQPATGTLSVTVGGGGKNVQWALFAMGAFTLHVLFLVFMQWRALFINFPGKDGLLLSFSPQDALSQWFMPMVFLAAALVQAWIYVTKERRLPTRQEWFYGVSGGLANGVGTFFMIWATEVSTRFEHAMIFPIFSAGVILLCNLWGRWLYQEKINWQANAFCGLGILIGTLNWAVLFG
jgi:drug/metabolite transporter (DMT)-like permease